MNIVTEDLFLKCGLLALMQQRKIKLNDNEVIFDFDHNFIILTTRPMLSEIKKDNHSFERFLLHPCLKIKKNISVKELGKILNCEAWDKRGIREYRSPLTRKERAVFSYMLNAEIYTEMFTTGVCDSNTYRTHKYNILRKTNLPSIATLTQVHNRWKNYYKLPLH